MVVLGTWCGFVSGFHRSTAAAVATWCVSFLAVIGSTGCSTVIGAASNSRSSPCPQTELAGPSRCRPRQNPSWHFAVASPPPRDRRLGGARHRHRPAFRSLDDQRPRESYRAIDAALLFVWILVGIGYGIMRPRTPADDGSSPRDANDAGVASSSAAIAVAMRPETPVLGVLLPNNRAAGVTFWVGSVGTCVLADVTARVHERATRDRGRILETGLETTRSPTDLHRGVDVRRMAPLRLLNGASLKRVLWRRILAEASEFRPKDWRSASQTSARCSGTRSYD